MIKDIVWRMVKCMNFKFQKPFSCFYFLFIFFVVLFFIFLFVLFHKKIINTYQMIPFVAIGEDTIEGVVSTSELSWLEKNKYLLIDGEKILFNITSVQRKVMKKKRLWYHQVELKLTVSKYHFNDSLLVGVLQKKKTFSYLFFEIWKGES